MEKLLAFAAILACDPVEDFKIPCLMKEGMPVNILQNTFSDRTHCIAQRRPASSFLLSALRFLDRSYYTKLKLMVSAPMAIALVFCGLTFGLHMGRAHFRHRRQSTHKKARRRLGDKASNPSPETDWSEAEYRINMRGSARRGLETCISILCMIFDLAYPVCSRTVLQIFRCRKLGEAGFYLEADYALRCYDREWNQWVMLAGAAALIYVVGVPIAFFLIVRHYRKAGKLNDPDVQRMCGFMYHPFRETCTYWLPVELLRKLLLTSCIGFMARSCHYKLLLSQLVAFGFLGAFLIVRPYRRQKHHVFQAIAMLIPALGMHVETLQHIV